MSPIGAGDAFAAAFTWAMEKKKSFPESARWGVATGTASARLPGLQFAGLALAKEVHKRVEVKSIPVGRGHGVTRPAGDSAAGG